MNSAPSLKIRLTQWTDRNNQDSSRFAAAVRRVCKVLFITAREFTRNSLFIRSGALTFAILLSLVPMLAISTALYKGLGGSDHLKMAAYRYIANLESNHLKIMVEELKTDNSRIQPQKDVEENSENPSSLTTHLRSAIDKLFDYVDKINFATLGIYGMIGLFIGVLLVFDNMESALNAIWHVRRGRSLIRKIADYLALLLMMPLSVNIALAAAAFQNNSSLFSYFKAAFPFPWMQAFLLHLFPVFCIVLTFYVIYIFFPNTKVRTIPALIGAGFASVFWILLQNIYLTLQIGVASYNAIYGSFATLPLFLTWMYFGVVCVLSGGQLAFACQNSLNYRLVNQPGALSQRLATGLEIMDHIQHAFASQTHLTATSLRSYFPHLDNSLLTEMLHDLEQAGLVHYARSNGQLLPGGEASTLSCQFILARLLQSFQLSDLPADTVPNQPQENSPAKILEASAEPSHES